MLSDKESKKVWVHLYGGEQDGFRRKIELKTSAPKKFFIWHINDSAAIDAARGKERMVLQSRLAVMAYEQFDEVEIEEGNGVITEYRYRRCEASDKVASSDTAV